MRAQASSRRRRLALLRAAAAGLRRPGAAPGLARDPSRLRRHRLRRGTRGSTPLPPRPARHDGARRRAPKRGEAARVPARRPRRPCLHTTWARAGDAFAPRSTPGERGGRAQGGLRRAAIPRRESTRPSRSTSVRLGFHGLAGPANPATRRAAARTTRLHRSDGARQAPRPGAAVQANALIVRSPGRRARWLPEILARRGDARHGPRRTGERLRPCWLNTAPFVDDDPSGHSVINGQKIWTTTYCGKYMFLAARTDRDARPGRPASACSSCPWPRPESASSRPSRSTTAAPPNIFYDDVRSRPTPRRPGQRPLEGTHRGPRERARRSAAASS